MFCLGDVGVHAVWCWGVGLEGCGGGLWSGWAMGNIFVSENKFNALSAPSQTQIGLILYKEHSGDIPGHTAAKLLRNQRDPENHGW